MRWLSTLLLVVLAAWLCDCTLANTLEEITDSDLDKLIRQEKYVVVLFSDDDHTERSEELEVELAAIREDLVDSLNAWVVKAEKSELKKLHAPDPEPVIVFFRDNFPVIYDGPANEEEMLETLMQYRERCTQDLTDTSFEHLTQASTGATTGDWLILFHREVDCEACNLLTARFETVACKHKGRINVARVNKGTTGAVTGRRFGVTVMPALIFLRLGKMYRYEVDKLDVDSISAFIGGWYKNVQSEPIPQPKSPFDDLLQTCVDYLREYPLLFALFAAIPVLLLSAFFFLTSGSDDGGHKRSKKSKKSKSSTSSSSKKKEQQAKKES